MAARKNSIVLARSVRVSFKPSLAAKMAVFIDLYGNSIAAINTKRGAKALARDMRKAAKMVDQWAKMIGTKY